jgi:hypothetical protein
MSQWNISRSTLFILSCLVFIMLLIVVLPDVDLPDTAFHQGTAPLVVHASGTTAPAAVAVAAVFQLPDPPQISRSPRDSQGLAQNLDPNFRPILLRTIRC